MSFDRFASAASRVAGRSYAFSLAVFVVVAWAATGPVFHYSDTWQISINTGTTIVTFLMVFLLQATQNRDAAALHAKTDEIIRATASARNELIGIEQRTDQEIADLKKETQ